jgi:N-acyl homoserine lactone hydrolase
VRISICVKRAGSSESSRSSAGAVDVEVELSDCICEEAIVYELTTLIHGFPGRSTHHGGLGWSTVSLLRGHGETIIVDPGGYNYRMPLLAELARLGIDREDVTAVALTHCHWDHACNVTLFPNARIVVSRAELEWATRQPAGTWELPELHVEYLDSSDRVVRVEDGDEPLPGFVAIATPGHTPGHFAYLASLASGRRAVFAGDAIKNEVELVSGAADMTLDANVSRASIEAIRTMMSDDPDLILVCGHDRQLSLSEGEVVAHSRLEAGITIWSPTSETTPVVDLLADVRF